MIIRVGIPNVALEYGIRCVGDTVDNSAYVRSCGIQISKIIYFQIQES